MKRGLITWDRQQIPPDVFERRIARVRRVLAERDLPALAVYSDVWRSNQARFFSNYMPYFNRALLIIPGDRPLSLLCGLSPRVYDWIRSVTIIEDIRPAGNFAKPLFDLAAEGQWGRLGVLELERLPFDIFTALRSGPLSLVDVPPEAVYSPAGDESELSMLRTAEALVNGALAEQMPGAAGVVDHEFVGRLERSLRSSGAEDLIVLVTNGRTPPAPASGAVLESGFSVSVAMEYRGHWIRVSRAHGTAPDVKIPADSKRVDERLDGAYPYECGAGAMTVSHAVLQKDGRRQFVSLPAL